MTITIGFWFWPIALVAVGFAGAIFDHIRDSEPHGYLDPLGRGCLGVVFCAACWLLAAGLAAGKLLG